MKARQICLFFGLLMAQTTVTAQIIGSRTDSSGMVWNVRFVTDGSPFPIWLQHQERYAGEYYLGDQNWTWQTTDTVFNPTLQDNWFYNVRLGVQLNLVKNLYVGANYSGYFWQRRIRNPDGSSNFESISFVTFNGSLSYPFALPFASKLEVLPTVSLGNYQSDSYLGYEGLGQEWSLEGRLGLGIRMGKQAHKIRFWAAYNRMWYEESRQSWVYPDRQREISTVWQFLNFGLGLVWHLRIEEDR